MDQRFAWSNKIYKNHLNLIEEKGKLRAKPLIGEKEVHNFFSKYLSKLGSSSSSRREVDPSQCFTKKSLKVVEQVISQQDFISALMSFDTTEEGYFFIKHLVVDFLHQNLTPKNFEKMLNAAINLHLYSEFRKIALVVIGKDVSNEWLKFLSKEPKARKHYFEMAYSRGEVDLELFSKIERYKGLGQISDFSRGFRHVNISSAYSMKMTLRAYLFPKDFVAWFDSIENVPFQLEVYGAIHLDKDKELIEILVQHIDFSLNENRVSKSVFAPLIIDATIGFYKDLVSSLEVTARNAGYNDHTSDWKEKAEKEKIAVENSERPQFFTKFFDRVLKTEGGVLASIDTTIEMARSVYFLESKEDEKESPTLSVYTAVMEALLAKKVSLTNIYDRYLEISNGSIQFDGYSKGYAFLVGIDLANTSADWPKLYTWLVDLMVNRQNLITSMANEFSNVGVASYRKIATIIYEAKIKLEDLEDLWSQLYLHRGNLIFGRAKYDELAASKFLISLEFAMFDLHGSYSNSINLEDLWRLIQKQQVLLYDNYNILTRIDDHIYLKPFLYVPAVFKEKWKSVLQEQWYCFSHKKRFVLLVAASLKANGIEFSKLDEFFKENKVSLKDCWQEANDELLWRTNSQKAVKSWIQQHIGDEFR